MTKRICLSGSIALLFAAAILTGCASVLPRQRTPLTLANASILRGTWSGKRDSGSYTAATELLITTDRPPFEGKWTLMSVSPAMQEVMGKRGQDTIAVDFKNGTISNQGTLYINPGDNNFIELTLYMKEGKPHLEGEYYFYITKGKISLNKR